MTPTITRLICDQVEHPDLRPLADDPTSFLRDDLLLHQVHVVALAMEIEDALDCRLTDDAIHSWRTVADVIASVERAIAMQTLINLDGDLI